jgi:hypothetical protein
LACLAREEAPFTSDRPSARELLSVGPGVGAEADALVSHIVTFIFGTIFIDTETTAMCTTVLEWT